MVQLAHQSFMIPSVDFRVGDYIIDSEQIYRVSKIDKDRLYYLPADTNDKNQTVSGSIPLANALSSGFRTLITPAEIKNFFKQLTQKQPIREPPEPIDPKNYKEFICQNDPFKTIPLLQQLWITKNKPDVTFSSNNRLTLESTLNHLAEEFSLVTKKPINSIKNKITRTLSQTFP
jgi:RNA polymerase-interacting CarD/CdnL/TRCF family regulator